VNLLNIFKCVNYIYTQCVYLSANRQFGGAGGSPEYPAFTASLRWWLKRTATIPATVLRAIETFSSANYGNITRPPLATIVWPVEKLDSSLSR
jgi:hypothetical protein